MGFSKINFTEINEAMLAGILDAMQDWVRVIDTNDTMIYINRAMQEGLGEDLTGNKCYTILGRSEACDNCISRQAMLSGKTYRKDEYIGEKVFSVISSPVKDKDGKIVAGLEVLRDITDLKNIQRKLTDKKNRLEKDLEMAKRLQNSILPKPFKNKVMDFSYIYMPCEDIGGDFVDVFSVYGNRTGFYIADVSGHGVSAAMLTMFLRSALNKKSVSPAKALTDLFMSFNNAGFESENYITVFYGIIDNENRKVTYSNAGHSVSPVLIGEERMEMLRTPGIPISNWVDEPSYKDESISLSEGDRIFFCSDGITEIRNKNGEYFGEERIFSHLSNINRGIEDVLKRITSDAMDFSCELTEGLRDDVTLCMLELK